MGCNRNCGLLTVATIGAVLAVLGGILILVGNHFIDKTVKKEVIIENGTIAYENWVLPGSPIYREIWVFDVQNPEDVMQNGSAPILKQKGPYTYRMRYIPKENITDHKDGTLSYFQPNIFIFQPDMSVGLENDTFTTVNLAVVYNKTLDGPYKIYSGKDDINKKGIITTYKNSRNLKYWTSYCNMVNGTDGTAFHPFVKKSEELYLFSSEVCRSIYLLFDRDVMVKEIPLYRFSIPALALASTLTNPDNICFCTERVVSRNCTTNGVLDVSSCKQASAVPHKASEVEKAGNKGQPRAPARGQTGSGVSCSSNYRFCRTGPNRKPVYLSLPHFLYGSQIIFQFVKGMEPNVEEHTIFLDVEPITGLTLAFSKRLQVNLLVQNNPEITALKNIKHYFYFPVLWLNETAAISDKKAEFFRSKVTNKIKLLNLVQLMLMIVGSVMFLGFLFAFFVCKGKNPK